MIKQCILILAKGQWSCAAGKVIIAVSVAASIPLPTWNELKVHPVWELGDEVTRRLA